MYTLTIGNKNYSSWSMRPWVLMRALGIPFTEQLLPFGDEAAWAPFRARGGSGKVPCLEAGDLRIWDSMAIVEYLAERHLGVWPEDADTRAWARCAAAEMHSGFDALRRECSMSCGVRVRLHAPSPSLDADLARLDALWREGLARWGGPFLAGHRFTAVDAFYGPVAFRILTYGLRLSPEALALADQLRTHPAVAEWYDAAVAETWRDVRHDRDVLAAGTLLEDLRAHG